MKRDQLLYGIIGTLIGGVIVWFLATTAVNNNNTSMMRMMGMNQSRQMSGDNDRNEIEETHGMGMDSSMDDMMSDLEGKLGDDFDKAFLSSMIIHHQGAIDMAQEAKTNAKHGEIKNMADDIISAQTSEINQMKQWQMDWGYQSEH
ncbi:MAG: DUF305 domain-containing protein [bacterium]|nr:DUF305 domain-containing protein [bacterium]